MTLITPAQIAKALDEVTHSARDHIVRTGDISRETREVLCHTKWLREIIRGYYLLTNPCAEDNETTVWQGVYWNFLSVYLKDRFENNYVLSPENSLDIHTRNTILPIQIVLQTTTGGQGETRLPQGHSLFSYRVSEKKMPFLIESHEGIRVYPLELALAKVGPSFFEKNVENAQIALRVLDVQKLARYILDGEAPMASVERLYHGLIGTEKKGNAERLRASLKIGGILLHDKNVALGVNEKKERVLSPHAERIKLMWQSMRETVIEIFPIMPGIKGNMKSNILESIEDIYTNDAYHSLSIEGYKVTKELIRLLSKLASADEVQGVDGAQKLSVQKLLDASSTGATKQFAAEVECGKKSIEQVRIGTWNSENPKDRQQIEAMAAKGYMEAFHAVKESISKVFDGEKASAIFENDLTSWFTAMFSPSIQCGLLKASDLAGYRNKPVYIRNSRHVPPSYDALMDCMEALFECLTNEPHAGVRAVLGHFIFTFIHPFHDGNGRIGRFLMNLMLVSGGYPWTIIRSEREHRTKYLQALEQASVDRNIGDFCRMVATEMAVDWS